MKAVRRSVPALAAGLVLPLLGGCSLTLLDPAGDVGRQERTLILLALGVMLLVVVPVIALTLFFAWRYRASNTQATYAPTWAHSTRIEVVVWTIPCIIVLALGVLIWRTTHTLDPYRPLDSRVPPVRVDVIALDWKWLFIYPDYGIASVNKLALPVATPVQFRITAMDLMNSFFIPTLGTQVYAMAGMQTRLNLIADRPGTYEGLSAAFSGEGFSDMHFVTQVTDRAGFDEWVQQARRSALELDQQTYEHLRRPSKGYPATRYANVDPKLFDRVVGQYMKAGNGAAHDAMPGMAMPSQTPSAERTAPAAGAGE